MNIYIQLNKNLEEFFQKYLSRKSFLHATRSEMQLIIRKH